MIVSHKLIISIIITLLMLITISMVINTINTPIEKRHFIIQSENDDGRTFETIGDQGFGNEHQFWADLIINPSYSFGLCFTNISIPKNSIIRSSHVALYSVGIPNRHDVVNCTIYADDVDSSVNLSVMGCLDRCGRIYSDNNIIWYEKLPFETWVNTPDISPVIQEIIKRDGWNEGNNIALLFITFNSNDSAIFQNFNQGNPARLYVEWTSD